MASAHHKVPKLTAVELAESQRLRLAVLRHGITPAALAGVTGMSAGYVARWLNQEIDLAPAHQRSIRGAYSGETGGPG